MKPLSIAVVIPILNAALGEVASMRLAEAHGGKRIDIPMAVGGVILAELGEAITAVLVDHYAGCKLDVPSWGHIQRMNKTLRLRQDILQSGLSANDLAFKHGVSSMYVRQLRRRMTNPLPGPPNQPNQPKRPAGQS